MVLMTLPAAPKATVKASKFGPACPRENAPTSTAKKTYVYIHAVMCIHVPVEQILNT